ncbi:MAG TPA: acyltransferase [Caulobacteraceae bacterium]
MSNRSPSDADGRVSQQRFTVLDGLRGVAAIAVVLYHANLQLRLPYFLPRAYLAVDFFFVLSGFVIAHAYENGLRTRRLTSLAFLKSRVVRLAPLALLGSIIGLAILLLAPAAMGEDPRNNPLFPVIVVTGLMLLPDIVPGGTRMYPLNAPLWSLFYELLANAAYALIAPRLSTRALFVLVVGAAMATLIASLGAHGVMYASPARVAYPFFAGVLVYRLWRAGKRAPGIHPMALAALLCAAFLIPDSSPLLSTAVDAACVIAVFPLIVWIGASSAAKGFWKPACNLFGEMSYPLYVIHFPLMLVATLILVRIPDQRIALAALFLSVFGLAMLALWLSRVFDRPLRGALQRVVFRARTPALEFNPS